jgi:polyisoprenoid-binding protein YceI
MKNLSIGIMTLLAPAVVSAQTQWKIDKAHSNIRFAVAHLVVSEVEGNFKMYDGTIISSGPTDFTDTKVDFSIDVNSLNTENEMRDKHLKSDDFFNAEKYPQIKFKSSSFTKITNKTYKLEGDLTIRDVTKKVVFDVTYNGSMKDPYGNIKAGFQASTKINRFDYKLKWKALGEGGGMVAGEEVKITVNMEVGLQK